MPSRNESENRAYEDTIWAIQGLIDDFNARLKETVYKADKEREDAEREISQHIAKLNSMKAALIQQKYNREQLELEEEKRKEEIFTSTVMVLMYQEQAEEKLKAEKRRNAKANTTLDYKRSSLLERKVKPILKNKKLTENVKMESFTQMLNPNDIDFKNAANDPEYFKKKREEHKTVYKNMLEIMARHIGLDSDANLSLEAQEKKLMTYMKSKNGYEEMLDRFKTHKAELEKQNLEVPEELNQLIERIDELAKETRKLQDDYIANKCSFESGNGYTNELVEKETKLITDIKLYSNNLLEKVLKEGQVDEAMANQGDKQYSQILSNLRSYEAAQMMTFYAEYQHRIDSALARNNELIEKMKTWEAFQECVKEKDKLMDIEDKEINVQFLAVQKIDRMMTSAYGTNDPVAVKCAQNASIDIQDMMDKIFSPEEITKADEPKIKDAICGMLINRMIQDEIISKSENKPILKYLENKKDDMEAYNSYKELVAKVSSTEQFKNACKEVFGEGKVTKEKLVNFLANDRDKEICQSFDRHTVISLDKKSEINLKPEAKQVVKKH